MNPEIKKLWTDALRSGEYEQTTGTLHKINQVDGEEKHSYCCLGVLCELAVKDGVVESKRHFGRDVGGYGPNGEVWFLPIPVREWAGMDSGDPEVEYGEYVNLASLNDANKLSFTELADVIEQQL
jgi:hypothetical protein